MRKYTSYMLICLIYFDNLMQNTTASLTQIVKSADFEQSKLSMFDNKKATNLIQSL